MTSPRKKKVKPISSFPTAYLSSWKEALKREVRLNTKDPTGRKRTNLRQKMNAFRRRFAEERPDEGELLFGAEAVFDKEDKSILILRPSASNEDVEMFRSAGVPVNGMEDGHTTPSSTDPDDLAKEMEKLLKEEEEN